MERPSRSFRSPLLLLLAYVGSSIAGGFVYWLFVLQAFDHFDLHTALSGLAPSIVVVAIGELMFGVFVGLPIKMKVASIPNIWMMGGWGVACGLLYGGLSWMLLATRPYRLTLADAGIAVTWVSVGGTVGVVFYLIAVKRAVRAAE